MSGWVKRPDLNWCYNCWFNAKIESRKITIGTQYICHYCGFYTTIANDDIVRKMRESDSPFTDFVVSNNHEKPRFFTEEEWKKWHAEYVSKPK